MWLSRKLGKRDSVRSGWSAESWATWAEPNRQERSFDFVTETTGEKRPVCTQPGYKVEHNCSGVQEGRGVLTWEGLWKACGRMLTLSSGIRPGSTGWVGQEGRPGGTNCISKSRRDGVCAGQGQVHRTLSFSFISDSDHGKEMLQKP